jgi:hypothetical protein
MKGAYLQVTYRGGRPIAAYYYLPRTGARTSVRVEERCQGMLVDFAAEGDPLGIEITTPSITTLDGFNEVLQSLGFAPATPQELAPLRAA